MAQTYSFEEMILLNYDKLPDGVDLNNFDFEESQKIQEVSEIKDELNHLRMQPSEKSIRNIMAFSAVYHTVKASDVQTEMILN